jgi:hypothetical protein
MIVLAVAVVVGERQGGLCSSALQSARFQHTAETHSCTHTQRERYTILTDTLLPHLVLDASQTHRGESGFHYDSSSSSSSGSARGIKLSTPVIAFFLFFSPSEVYH